MQRESGNYERCGAATGYSQNELEAVMEVLQHGQAAIEGEYSPIGTLLLT